MIDYPWSTNSITPKLTGIPPHIVLLSKLHTIEKNLENLKNDFKDVLVKELDSREIGSNNFTAHRVIDELQTTRDQLREMLQGCVIDRRYVP